MRKSEVGSQRMLKPPLRGWLWPYSKWDVGYALAMSRGIQHFCLKLSPSTQYLTLRLFSFWRWELQEALHSENLCLYLHLSLNQDVLVYWNSHLTFFFSCKFNFRHMFCTWAVMKNDRTLRNHFGISDNSKTRNVKDHRPFWTYILLKDTGVK